MDEILDECPHCERPLDECDCPIDDDTCADCLNPVGSKACAERCFN